MFGTAQWVRAYRIYMYYRVCVEGIYITGYILRSHFRIAFAALALTHGMRAPVCLCGSLSCLRQKDAMPLPTLTLKLAAAAQRTIKFRFSGTSRARTQAHTRQRQERERRKEKQSEKERKTFCALCAKIHRRAKKKHVHRTHTHIHPQMHGNKIIELVMWN